MKSLRLCQDALSERRMQLALRAKVNLYPERVFKIKLQTNDLQQ